MITKKIEYLEEHLFNVIMFAVTEALRYPGENSHAEFEKEYDTIKTMLADYGVTNIPLFEDAFYASFRHTKALTSEKDKEYWLAKGGFMRMCKKDGIEKVHKFIDNELVEAIVEESNIKKRKFLSGVLEYIRKIVKNEKEGGQC